MAIFQNYTTDDLGRLVMLPALPSFVDPDEDETLSVSYDTPQEYFFSQMEAFPSKSSSVKSDPSFGRPRKVKKEVRFLDTLSGTNRGIPSCKDRNIPFAQRGWSAREAYSWWQERYRWCPCLECKVRCDWWFSLGFQWGWDTRYPLGIFHSPTCWGCRECIQ
jgi:hypothetical protein